MSRVNRKKRPQGCLKPGVILGVFVIVILGLISGAIFLLIDVPNLKNNTEKTKLVTVKSNMSNAITVIAGNLLIDKMSTQEATNKGIIKLNTNKTPDNTSDDLYSPYEGSLPAFSTKPAPGAVVIEAKNPTTVIVTAYDKNQKPLGKKIILTNEKKDDIKVTDE